MKSTVPGTWTPYTLTSWIKSTSPSISATSVVATFSPFHLQTMAACKIYSFISSIRPCSYAYMLDHKYFIMVTTGLWGRVLLSTWKYLPLCLWSRWSCPRPQPSGLQCWSKRLLWQTRFAGSSSLSAVCFQHIRRTDSDCRSSTAAAPSHLIINIQTPH